MRIDIESLDFGYSRDKKVLSGIDLSLEGPGLVCVIGPNGVGKSTLIKCINKILSPTSGRVLLNGRDIKEMSLKQIAEFVGYVPVTSEDCFSMPVIDTILIGRSGKSKWRTTDEDLNAVYRVMKLLKIEDLAMRGFNELSAGQHQKVAIARGLVQEPEILILDEPTSNLDIKHQVYVTELLRTVAIKRNMMILMISHDINISAKNAHKIVVMSEPGTISHVGTPNEVITEDMIRNVYGMRCTVVMDGSRPHIMLGSTLDD